MHFDIEKEADSHFVCFFYNQKTLDYKNLSCSFFKKIMNLIIRWVLLIIGSWDMSYPYPCDQVASQVSVSQNVLWETFKTMQEAIQK